MIIKNDLKKILSPATKIYQLDENDFELLRDKCKDVIKFNW